MEQAAAGHHDCFALSAAGHRGAAVSLTSSVSIQRMARYKSSEYLAGMRANLPALILTARDSWLVASKGGARAHSSYSRQPRAQMSLFSLYLHSFTISGDM
jgi:hypothetical protein